MERFYMKITDTSIEDFGNKDGKFGEDGYIGSDCKIFDSLSKDEVSVEFLSNMAVNNKVYGLDVEVVAEGLDYDLEDSLKLWMLNSLKVMDFCKELPPKDVIMHLPSENVMVTVDGKSFSLEICKMVSIPSECIGKIGGNKSYPKAFLRGDNIPVYKFTIVVNKTVFMK